MGGGATATEVDVRLMRETDLEVVLDIMNAAFAQLIEKNTGKRPVGPMFSPLLGTYRLALDPEGCHVAVSTRGCRSQLLDPARDAGLVPSRSVRMHKGWALPNVWLPSACIPRMRVGPS